MKITVDPQAMTFHLNFKSHWQQAVGHEITVGEYRFCVTPIDNVLKVSEITTGALVMDLPRPEKPLSKTESLKAFEAIGKLLLEEMKRSKHLSTAFENLKQESFRLLGETPAPEVFELVEVAE